MAQVEGLAIIDAIRFVVGAVVLSYASYTDMKTRTAENYLWYAMAGAGALLLALQFILFPSTANPFYLIYIPVVIGLVYLLYQFRLIFGGADAKALFAITILAPFWPSFAFAPSIMPFSISVLTNALLAFLAMPIALFFYNLSRGDVRLPHAFIGYRVPIERAQRSFVWPMEYMENGKVKTRYFPREGDTAGEMRLLRAYGLRRIWVTPKVPFMIPLTVGFLLSFIVGDIMFWIVSSIMG